MDSLVEAMLVLGFWARTFEPAIGVRQRKAHPAEAMATEALEFIA